MKSIIKLASVAVFGVMAMAVTGSVKPLSVGFVSEAQAGSCTKECTGPITLACCVRVSGNVECDGPTNRATQQYLRQCIMEAKGPCGCN